MMILAIAMLFDQGHFVLDFPVHILVHLSAKLCFKPSVQGIVFILGMHVSWHFHVTAPLTNAL